MWWTILLDKVFGGVTDYFKVKQEHKQALEAKKMELEVAKVTSEISMVEKQQDTDNNIDMYTIRDRGWKDDIFSYVIISPFIVLVFNPLLALVFNYDPAVVTMAMTQGFDALKSIPEPWWYGLLIVMSDIFGLRSFMRDIFKILADRMASKIKQ